MSQLTEEISRRRTFAIISHPDAGKTRFVDVSDNAWYASAVNYVVDKGLMNGTGEDKFSPNADTTRGMIVTVLARLDGKNTAGTPWYAAGQRWAMEYEIPTARI